ncbi:hypothetical protein GCM10009838_48680 [Catenulispora subtropica]|uniref:Uncharacterized protein n=1 Tax=Catenulispora subtropica TaxID=450798 RepID=A0ABN2S786_9ACTN
MPPRGASTSAPGPEPAEDTEDDDNAAVLRSEREALVARLHEADIPVRPSSTGTYNVDHAYGTAARAMEYVEQLAAIGVEEVICLIQMGTVPTPPRWRPSGSGAAT